jgi:pimeloyl-ACP methyl ester carboxylesterase
VEFLSGNFFLIHDRYDAANMAENVHQLAAALKLEPVYIVGHDIGGMVAYALFAVSASHTRGYDPGWGLNGVGQ